MSYHFSLHNIVSRVDKKIIIDNIENLKTKDFNVEIMSTVSKTNYMEIEEMVSEAISLKVDCIRFTNLFNEGRATNIGDDLVLDDSQINQFFDQFYRCKIKYGDKILVRRSGTFSRDFRKEKSSYYCPCIENTVAIAPNGNVYPCPFLVKDGYEIGKYENGHVYLDNYYENDNTVCFLHEVLNRKSICKKETLSILIE